MQQFVSMTSEEVVGFVIARVIFQRWLTLPKVWCRWMLLVDAEGSLH